MQYNKNIKSSENNNENLLNIGNDLGGLENINNKKLASTDADMLEIIVLSAMIEISEKVIDSLPNKKIDSVESIQEYISKASDASLNWLKAEQESLSIVFTTKEFCNVVDWFIQKDLETSYDIKESVVQMPEIKEAFRVNKEKLLKSVEALAVNNNFYIEDINEMPEIKTEITKESVTSWLYKIRKEKDYEMSAIKRQAADDVIHYPIDEFKGKTKDIKKILIELRNDEIQEEDPELYALICNVHEELLLHSASLNRPRKLTTEEIIKKGIEDKKAAEVVNNDTSADIAGFDKEIQQMVNSIKIVNTVEPGSNVSSINTSEEISITVDEIDGETIFIATPAVGGNNPTIDNEFGVKGSVDQLKIKSPSADLIKEYQDKVQSLENKGDGSSQDSDRNNQERVMDEETLLIGRIKSMDIYSIIHIPIERIEKFKHEALIDLISEAINRIVHMVNMKQMINFRNENRFYLLHKMVLKFSLVLLKRGNPIMLKYYQRLLLMVKYKTYTRSYTVREIFKNQMLKDIPMMISSISRSRVKNGSKIIEELEKIRDTLNETYTSVQDMLNDENPYYCMIAKCIKGYKRSLKDSQIVILRDKDNQITAEVTYWEGNSKKSKQLHFKIGIGLLSNGLTVIPMGDKANKESTLGWLNNRN